MLIALPWGLGVGGVTTWAVRLANGLAAKGRACGLVIHPEPAGSAVLAAGIDPRVRLTRLRGVPAIDECRGDVSVFVPWYERAAAELGGEGPVVISPNLHGDCYGVAATLATMQSERRVVGWQHSDIEYDTRVLCRYAPALSGCVAVSGRIAGRLRESGYAGAVDEIPYGVEVPEECPRRAAPRKRPVRLVYTGRLDHGQKRVTALATMSKELAARRVAHELVIVGDGPARDQLREAAAGSAAVRMPGALPPAAVTALLDGADALVLASRYEGLSVSMLEALARGCVPIVTRVESGLLEAIEDGVNGLVADVAPEAGDEAAGRALADAVDRFLARDAAAMSLAAWGTARERFSLALHVERVMRLLDRAAAAPPPSWPAGVPLAFTAGGAGGSGSVPADGAERMRRVLEGLAGRRVVIHGTGEHTRQLREVILASPARVVAFADDDRSKQGSELWGLPVIAPAAAAACGATDAVLSTWMHQDAVWWRRGEYGGVAVHRLYA